MIVLALIRGQQFKLFTVWRFNYSESEVQIEIVLKKFQYQSWILEETNLVFCTCHSLNEIRTLFQTFYYKWDIWAIILNFSNSLLEVRHLSSVLNHESLSCRITWCDALIFFSLSHGVQLDQRSDLRGQLSASAVFEESHVHLGSWSGGHMPLAARHGHSRPLVVHSNILRFRPRCRTHVWSMFPSFGTRYLHVC